MNTAIKVLISNYLNDSRFYMNRYKVFGIQSEENAVLGPKSDVIKVFSDLMYLSSVF